MKKRVVAIASVLMSLTAYGQIQLLRYNDDFSFLKNDSAKTGAYYNLKYIPLPGMAKASFGGEIREQLQWYDNINFGDVPANYRKSSTWQLWHRMMAHVNIDAGKKTRVFLQLNSTYRFLNPNPLTTEIDQNELNLHQAFIDYRFNRKWMARIGRQEMSYGNHRLITFREGPNTRLAFDAAILKYRGEKSKIDLFSMSPVVSQTGVFDDLSFKDLLAGIYASQKLTKKILIDYYLFHFHSKQRRYNFVAGVENREIAGFRLFTENLRINYEIEANYQFGRFANVAINAYGISADINYRLLPTKNITVGLSGNYLTGDKTTDDKQLNTYNLLYSKPQYGLAAPIGATNIIAINPYLRINPTKKGAVYLGTNFLWRQSDHDGTYSPGAIQLRPKPEDLFISSEKQLGILLVLETGYTISSNLSASVDISRFFAGKFARETGSGSDISYISFKLSCKF